MRPHKQVPSVNRRPTVLYLVCAAAFFSLFLFYLQSSFFAGSLYSDRNSETIRVLSNFQSTVQHCVDNRGLGLTAHVVDHCKLILKYPKDTNSTWLVLNPERAVLKPEWPVLKPEWPVTTRK
ncbi:sialyltransferase-like protein 1 [Cajanus cajan]|uniref:sialyltransferase-like protein 1 n=1 Tax=Cajanus cajan TaxID=3821 RepID=UPI0010FB4F2F|nr:sialyltransferase-like protein 1 [Cajanus cajan]